MRRGELIYNPAGGGGRPRRTLERVGQVLTEAGWRIRPVPTLTAGEAGRLAREAVQRGAEAIFALGGDGHLREVAAGLLGSSVPLAPLPGGTTNVLAGELGLGGDPVDAARVAAVAAPRPIDVGRCADQPFLMQASAGIDAVALARVQARWKRRFGRLAVAATAIAIWLREVPPRLRIEVDGEHHEGAFAAVCNISRYAGPLELAPARPDDGRLHLVLLAAHGRRAVLRFARDLLLGRHLDRDDVLVRPVRRVTLLEPARLPLQLDGDAHPRPAPVVVELAEEKLWVLAGEPSPGD